MQLLLLAPALPPFHDPVRLVGLPRPGGEIYFLEYLTEN